MKLLVVVILQHRLKSGSERLFFIRAVTEDVSVTEELLDK